MNPEHAKGQEPVGTASSEHVNPALSMETAAESGWIKARELNVSALIRALAER